MKREMTPRPRVILNFDNHDQLLLYGNINFNRTLRFCTFNCNAFVLDAACISQSKERNTLVLRCHYKVPYIENLEICYKWDDCYVTLDDLTFNAETYKIYYSDFYEKEIEIKSLLEQQSISGTFENYWINRNSLAPEECYTQDRVWIRKFGRLGHLSAEQSRHEHFPSGLFQLLDALYSMKHQRMIGFRYKTNVWQQMTHSFLTRHPKFAGSYIAGLKHFRLYEKLLANDKKGFMKRTIDTIRDGIHQDNPLYRQDLSFRPLLELLFRDVFK